MPGRADKGRRGAARAAGGNGKAPSRPAATANAKPAPLPAAPPPPSPAAAARHSGTATRTGGTATRTLALCADDFGASAAVDRGIFTLLRQGRLSDVSCVVNGPEWQSHARTLAGLPAVKQGRVRIGLHLNLTDGKPLSANLARHWPGLPTLATLLVRSHLGAHLGLLPLDALRAEVQVQLDTFERATGRPPDHIAGHHHVHHLPGIRGLVLQALERQPGLRARNTGSVRGPGFAARQRIVEGSGGSAFGRRLLALGRAANAQLLGVYDFQHSDYRGLMQGWLAALPVDGGLIICHPAEPADRHDVPGWPDPIAGARIRELAYLASDAFAADLAAACITLASRPGGN